jgi:cytochrome c biogenesis protein CcmG, thiol:disulfide interchange protein DsbE
LLAQEVVAKFDGKVKFVTENFGESKLAEQYGITRYPAVFVNDILLARPRDFGFVGTDEKEGRYSPWLKAESQEKFRADLTKLVELVLAGKNQEAVQRGEKAETAPETIAALPKFKAVDLNGKLLSNEALAGRVVVVDFWATWCPSCLGTLQWLKDLSAKHPEKLAIVALAVESPEAQVKKLSASGGSVTWALTDEATARSFGDVVAVPTMYVFDKSGKTVKVFYGAPPSLHGEAQALIGKLVDGS